MVKWGKPPKLFTKIFHKNVILGPGRKSKTPSSLNLGKTVVALFDLIRVSVTGLYIENFPSSSLTLYQNKPFCSMIRDCQLRNLFFSLDLCTILIFDGSSISYIFTITGLICWSILYGPVQNFLNKIGSLTLWTGLY